MKRFLIAGASAISLAAGAAIALAMAGSLPRGMGLDGLFPEARFVKRWSGALRSCEDAGAADAAVRGNREGGRTVRMADGSWVAVVMEHECCTGAGFNATLYVTSAGEVYLDSESCYCGWLPLEWELREYPESAAPAFLQAVREAGKPLTRL